jgi:hypothetical protein
MIALLHQKQITTVRVSATRDRAERPKTKPPRQSSTCAAMRLCVHMSNREVNVRLTFNMFLAFDYWSMTDHQHVGRLGLTAIRFLAALAQFELERHDQWLAAQGLDPLVDPSVRAQYRRLWLGASESGTALRLLVWVMLSGSPRLLRCVYLLRRRFLPPRHLPVHTLLGIALARLILFPLFPLLLPSLSLYLFLLLRVILFFSALFPIFEHLWPSFLIKKSCVLPTRSNGNTAPSTCVITKRIKKSSSSS